MSNLSHTDNNSSPRDRKRRGRRALSTAERRQREDTIRHAALAVFKEKGYEDASMTAIATAAGCTEGTLYLYFKNKFSLLCSVGADFYREYVTDVKRGLEDRAGFREKLVFLVERDIRVYLEEPALCRMLYSEVKLGFQYQHPSIQSCYEEYLGLVTKVIAKGVEDKEVRSDVPVTATMDSFLGMLSVIREKILFKKEEFNLTVQIPWAIELLMNGFSADNRATDDTALAQEVSSLNRRLKKLLEKLN